MSDENSAQQPRDTPKEEGFRYSGYTFVIEKDDAGQLKVFRKTRKGLVAMHGQRAYQVARAYKLKVDKTPSARRPRAFAKRAKRKRY
ncbi:MAG: hypothetical protein AAF708_05620 [Deinococcota bacterium]